MVKDFNKECMNLVSVIKGKNGYIISKNLYQSFIMSFAKYNYSINEERILIAIVNSLQDIIKDSINNIDNDIVVKMINSFDYIETDICISDLCESSRIIRYSELIDVCKSLSNKTITIEYKNKDTGDIINKNVNLLTGYIEFTNKHNIRVGINKDIALCLIDMSMGYNGYNMRYILRLKSSYSMRIFRFICNKAGSSVFCTSIESFINKLCLGDSYIRNSNNLYSLLKRITNDINSDYVGWDKKVRYRISKNIIYFDVANKNEDFDTHPNLKKKTNSDKISKTIERMEMLNGKNIIDMFRNLLYMDDKFISLNALSIQQFISIYILGTSKSDEAINRIHSIIENKGGAKCTKRKNAMAIINSYISVYMSKNDKI